MKKRIIFLDFDGVVNTIYYRYYKRFKKYQMRYAASADGIVNNRQAIQWLNELYDKYPYDIVVTSTWRLHSNCIQILYNSGLNKKIKIIGYTPYLEGKTRGEEIKKWIEDNNYINFNNFIILDDDTDMGDLDSHLIKCDPYLGFTIYEFNKCIDFFKKK